MAIPAFYSTLRPDTRGPDVALVQTWLNGVRDACSWYGALRADGHYGKATENAVREFQLRGGLTSDGKTGRATWDALGEKYAAAHGAAVPYPGIALRTGDAGASVRYVQQALARLGYALTADGRYGAKTAAAVRAWQTKAGLAADGVFGQASWQALF